MRVQRDEFGKNYIQSKYFLLLMAHFFIIGVSICIQIRDMRQMTPVQYSSNSYDLGKLLQLMLSSFFGLQKENMAPQELKKLQHMNSMSSSLSISISFLPKNSASQTSHACDIVLLVPAYILKYFHNKLKYLPFVH